MAPPYTVPADVERAIRVELRAAANHFLDMWRTESEAGLARLRGNAPAADTSKAYAWIALAGNLLWAGTCLVAPEAAGAILVMSFVGAGVPAVAGLYQVYENPEPTETNLNILSSVISLNLASARDRVNVSNLVDRAFRELVTNEGITDMATGPERRERGLWGLTFGVPYQGGSTNLQQAAFNGASRVAALARRFYPEYEGQMASRGYTRLAEAYAGYGISMWTATMANPREVVEQELQAPRTSRLFEPFDRWLFRRAPYLSLAGEFGLRAPSSR